MTYELSDSVEIAASPQAVYELVSDVARTGEWSVQTWQCVWEDPSRTGPGARFVGYNRTPHREWETTSEVVAADPGHEFSWKVLPAGTRWGYLLEPAGDGGTRLTEFTRVGEHAMEFYRERWGEDAERQVGLSHDAAQAGIPETLAAIKRIAEA